MCKVDYEAIIFRRENSIVCKTLPVAFSNENLLPLVKSFPIKSIEVTPVRLSIKEVFFASFRININQTKNQY
jgi:hypothetical protein